MLSHLFCRLSCDKKVLAQMRGRTLGNSAARLRSYLVEQHTTAWIDCCLRFMGTYKHFVVPGVSAPPPPALPQMAAVPSRQWILRAYATDSFSRLGEMRAKLTSVYGSILKMDSTKKVDSSDHLNIILCDMYCMYHVITVYTAVKWSDTHSSNRLQYLQFMYFRSVDHQEARRPRGGDGPVGNQRGE